MSKSLKAIGVEKDVNYKTTTYKYLDFPEWRLDIININGYRELWIGRSGFSIKRFLYGIQKGQPVSRLFDAIERDGGIEKVICEFLDENLTKDNDFRLSDEEFDLYVEYLDNRRFQV